VTEILKRAEVNFSLISWPETLILIRYIYLASPREILRVLWRYITDRDTPRRRRRIESLAQELRAKLSPEARIIEGYFERRIYSRDLARVPLFFEKILHRTTPLLAVQPRTEQDIVACVQFANRHKLPLFPRGISSSAFGGSVPTLNGLVLDFSSMNGILEINAAAPSVRVQPGVRWSDLNRALEPFGLCAMTTPTGLFSTIGGWLNSGGLGLHGFKYGHFRDAVSQARFILPNGQTLELKAGNDLLDFIGSEGQFGLTAEVTIKVRAQPACSRVFLFYFESLQQSTAFVEKLIARKHEPSHIALYDSNRLKEENELFAARIKRQEKIVKAQDAVLLHFDQPEAAKFFANDQELLGALQNQIVAAHYLWSERYFPLKAQRHGPSLLASEVMLPFASVAKHYQQARRLAKWYGTELCFEIFVAKPALRRNCVVIASFRCNASAKDYVFRLLLVQLLTRLGIANGGRPYGFGIWNSPFIKRIFPAETLTRLKALKQKCDPKRLLNPQKFFGLRSWIFNLPGLVFTPFVYEVLLRTARAFSPLLGMCAKVLYPGHTNHWQVPAESDAQGAKLIQEALQRCTSCGACISVCPAYIVSAEELVTGRAKLRVAEALMCGQEITRSEAISTLQCVHCGLCEEVCQTALPLRNCYRVLETMVARRFGWPHDLIESFIRKIDTQSEKVLNAYGLSRAQWKAPASRILETWQVPKPPVPAGELWTRAKAPGGRT
jgi:glycolate oxidase